VYDTCDEADTNPLGLFEIVPKSTCAELETKVGLEVILLNTIELADTAFCALLANDALFADNA
jgi:hypothetical protein